MAAGSGGRSLWVATGNECTAPLETCPSGNQVGHSVLYIAGNSTTIGGTSYGGSISAVNPQTGAFTWQTGLGCGVTGTPALDSAGELAVETYQGCVGGAVPGST